MCPGGFQLSSNWAGCVGLPGSWTPACNRVGCQPARICEVRREVEGAEVMVFLCMVTSFLLSLWQQQEEGDTPQTTPADQNCTQWERAAGCLPRSATQPASWGAATHSAAVAQGCSGSSFPWHRPSAGRKQTSWGQDADPSPSLWPQRKHVQNPSSTACRVPYHTSTY